MLGRISAAMMRGVDAPVDPGPTWAIDERLVDFKVHPGN
jgi:hypothetical protein